MPRLIDADEFAIEEPKLWDWSSVDGISSTAVLKQCIWDVQCAPTVKAIPIEVFYKMIHNALTDTKKENWEPEECPYDYFDGNRNAIHCMLDILCGDKDGDHDDFWKEYMDWEEENEQNKENTSQTD